MGIYPRALMGGCASSEPEKASTMQKQGETGGEAAAAKPDTATNGALPPHEENLMAFIDEDGDRNEFRPMNTTHLGWFVYKKGNSDAAKPDQSFNVDQEFNYNAGTRKISGKFTNPDAPDGAALDISCVLPADCKIEWIQVLAAQTTVKWTGDNAPTGDPSTDAPLADGTGKESSSRCCSW